jgi:hypothetical protein
LLAQLNHEAYFTRTDFMQPELSNQQPNILTPTNVADIFDTSQHGFASSSLLSGDLHGRLDEERSLSGDSSSISDGSEPRSPGRPEEQLSRLNLREGSQTRSKPSYQRISEYEKALSPSPPKKQNDGPGFVVTKKGGRLDGLPLDKFPNGKTIFPL